MSVIDDTQETHSQNITQLNYLGLRLCFKETRSERNLRVLAKRCVARSSEALHQWDQKSEIQLCTREIHYLEKSLQYGRGAVLCMPHVGPFKSVPHYLALRGIPTTLVVDSANFNRMHLNYGEWAERFGFPFQDAIGCIDAEAPDVAWKMLRELKDGKLVCIWLDGNTGLKNSSSISTSAIVNFLGIDIVVRKGAAFISAKANAPIVPAVATISRNGKEAVRFFAPIQRGENEAVDLYCQRTMQSLYAILEEQVRRDPACWASWNQLPSWRAANPVKVDTSEALAPEDLLRTKVELDRKLIVFLRLNGARTIVHESTGAAFVETQLIRSVMNCLNDVPIFSEIIERLTGKFSELEILEALKALATGGFIRVAGPVQI